MDDDQREPDGEAGEAGRRERVGDAENADEEQERPDHFEDEGRDNVILAEIPWPPAVLAEAARPALGLAREYEIEHCGGDDRAEHLGDPVADHVTGAHPPGDEHAEADRRVDVTAGNRTDPVGHGDDGEAECARDAEQVDRGRACAHAADDRRPAAEEYEGERSHKFRQLLIHFHLPFPVRRRRAAPYTGPREAEQGLFRGPGSACWRP